MVWYEEYGERDGVAECKGNTKKQFLMPNPKGKLSLREDDAIFLQLGKIMKDRIFTDTRKGQ